MKILEEKKNKGEINNDKYEIYGNKIKQKIKEIEIYEKNKDPIKAKIAERCKNKKVDKKVYLAEYRKNKKDVIKAKKC